MIGVTSYLFVNLKIVILNFQTSKFLVQEESLSNTSANGGIFKGREEFGGSRKIPVVYNALPKYLQIVKWLETWYR